MSVAFDVFKDLFPIIASIGSLILFIVSAVNTFNILKKIDSEKNRHNQQLPAKVTK